jgi:hypothetical protein
MEINDNEEASLPKTHQEVQVALPKTHKEVQVASPESLIRPRLKSRTLIKNLVKETIGNETSQAIIRI